MYSLLRPILFSLPPETAHELALESLRLGLNSDFLRRKFAAGLMRSPFGEIAVGELKFKNPVGVAAGMDKNGQVARQLAALGFGFVEVGTTTFHAQPGNDKPRLFRLPLDNALINRAGFNNEGTARVVERLTQARPDCVLGMNIGKSKIVEIENATADYLASFKLVHAIADYICVNVSSPNTPNLRELQKADHLFELLAALQNENRKAAKSKPLFVKIAPDLNDTEIAAICEIAVNLNLAGIVATNTTIGREDLKTAALKVKNIGAGGLSGAPVRQKSTAVIRTIFRLTGGKLPIIGVGGVFTAQDAFDKIAAGATLIQLYTGFVYQGLTVARDINDGLEKIFAAKKITTYQAAVGIENQ